MKIATFNVNGINGRLSIHLRWLEVSGPDVTLLRGGCGTHIGRGARSIKSHGRKRLVQDGAYDRDFNFGRSAGRRRVISTYLR